MPVRYFTTDRLPALLKFVEACNSWGDAGRELGLRTFEQLLGEPGFDPESNCLLLETNGGVQGYCLVIPELRIGRVVLEPRLSPELLGTPFEQELILAALERTEALGARVVHVCVPVPAPTADYLRSQGFTLVREYLDMVWRQDELLSTPLPEGFAVRSFRPGDASLLAEVQNSAFATSWGYCPNTAEQIAYRSSMANTSHEGILLLKHGENIAGYCWTCLAPVEGSVRGVIGMIGVVPDYRGKGISRHILTAGMEYLRSQNVADIGLQVDGSNTPGVRLYTSVGFKTAGALQWFELEPG